MPDKVLISRIYKELQKLNIKITELPVNKLVNEMDTSPKKKLKWAIDSFKKYLISLAVNKSKLELLEIPSHFSQHCLRHETKRNRLAW